MQGVHELHSGTVGEHVNLKERLKASFQCEDYASMWEAAGVDPARSYEKLLERFEQGLPYREQQLRGWELVHMGREDRNSPQKRLRSGRSTPGSLVAKLLMELSRWRKRLEYRQRQRQRCYWHRLRERLKVLKTARKMALNPCEIS